MSRSEKMYKNSPEMKRDEDSGNMKVKKKTSTMEESAPNENNGDTGIPVGSRHSVERMDMHARHQHEHHAHDHGKHGSKKDMHARHEKEVSEMHKRHEKELMHGSMK